MSKGRTLAAVRASGGRAGKLVLAVVGVAMLALGIASSGYARAAARPAQATGGVLELDAVSCKGTSFCVATGFYGTDGHMRTRPPVLDEWNGRGWRAIPQPSRGIVNMSSIQCTGPSFCLAQRRVLGPPVRNDIVLWNGKTWRTINLGQPYDPYNVTCETSTFCIDWRNTDEGRVITRWNGKHWQDMPLGTDGCGGEFCRYRGMSCASTTNCMISGSYCGDGDCDTEFDYTEAWNGTIWNQTTNPPFAEGEACAGRSFCLDFSLARAEFSRDWGHNWHDATANLAAVCESIAGCGTSDPAFEPRPTCASAHFCLASVTDHLGPVVTWNGTTWKAVPLTSFGGRNRDPFRMSCGSPGNCALIGTYQASKGGELKPFAEHWNGSAWKVTKLPAS